MVGRYLSFGWSQPEWDNESSPDDAEILGCRWNAFFWNTHKALYSRRSMHICRLLWIVDSNAQYTMHLSKDRATSGEGYRYLRWQNQSGMRLTVGEKADKRPSWITDICLHSKFEKPWPKEWVACLTGSIKLNLVARYHQCRLCIDWFHKRFADF